MHLTQHQIRAAFRRVMCELTRAKQRERETAEKENAQRQQQLLLRVILDQSQLATATGGIPTWAAAAARARAFSSPARFGSRPHEGRVTAAPRAFRIRERTSRAVAGSWPCFRDGLSSSLLVAQSDRVVNKFVFARFTPR